MKNLLLLIPSIFCIFVISCTKNEIIVNNYYDTSNFDSNWVKITDPVEVNQGHLFISQKGTIFLISGNVNYKSYDNCKTWTKFSSDSMVSNYNFYEGKNNIIYNFYNSSAAYMLGWQVLSKTTDDGNTWTEVNLPVIDTKVKNAAQISAFDVSKNGDLFFNISWLININDSTYSFVAEVFRSTDDGNSWMIMKNGNDTLKNICDFKTGCSNKLFASQRYDNINQPSFIQSIYSTEDGYSWQNGHDNIYVSGLFSDSSGIIYAIDNTGILRSTDNGINFPTINYRFYGDIKQLAFSKHNTLFCVTTYGLYESKDNGNNWNLLLIHSGIWNIAVSPDGFVYFKDSNYILYRSKQPIGK